jgi:hypothetical protein
MAQVVTVEPAAGEAANLRAEIEAAFDEMDRLREEMRRDNTEIERSRARTQSILDRLRTLLPAK